MVFRREVNLIRTPGKGDDGCRVEKESSGRFHQWTQNAGESFAFGEGTLKSVFIGTLPKIQFRRTDDQHLWYGKMRALLPFAFLNNGNELHDAGCYIRGIAASVLAEVVRPQHDDDHVQGHMRRKRCGKVRGSVHARAGNNAGAGTLRTVHIGRAPAQPLDHHIIISAKQSGHSARPGRVQR